MDNNPKSLEIVIMTVNRVEYLMKLIESFNASYARLSKNDQQFLKLRISDNGSTDGTPEFLAEISKDSKYFEIITRQTTVTVAEHMALIITECRCQYLWIVGDDDLFEKDCLQSIIDEVNVNSEVADVFLLNFKQVDKDGISVIKDKICNLPSGWSGSLDSKSIIGNGEFRGVFDMLFFVGSVIFKREIVSIQAGDFDGTTDWDHLPVYLRSFTGKKVKVIDKKNMIQRQRNHRKKSKNEKENSYRSKDVCGIRQLVAKLIRVHQMQRESTLIYSMKAPFILHENVYYDFIDFLKLVCHNGTLEKLADSQHKGSVFEDINFLVNSLPRQKDKLSMLNYMRDLGELDSIFSLATSKKNNAFERLRLAGKEIDW
jgi:glycosyltransferase involved in cell wall biosynthesis